MSFYPRVPFYFHATGTEIWEKLQFHGNKPHPRAESIALAVSEVLFKEKSNIVANSSCQSSSNLQNEKNNVRSFGSESNRNKNNKIGSVEKKYIFSECGNNYATGNLVTSAIQNNNLNFLKEISKLSSINLSRLNHKCNYSVLDSSHDSTESLLKGKESSDSEQTPTRMVKSQSANVIGNNEKKKNFSNLTPGTEKTSRSIVESGEFSITESDKSSKPLMSRDPVSVPNLNEFSANPTTAAATERLVNIDSDENESDSKKLNSFAGKNLHSVNGDEIGKINLPGTPFANEAKTRGDDDYRFSKRCQSDSYTSHLVTLGNVEENVKSIEGIPKSASVVRFKKHPEIADELTSDYCSIETVNKVSLSSNYSQSPGDTNRDLMNDYPEIKFGKSVANSLAKKSIAGRGVGLGFSNPHYLGPDVQTILKSKEIEKCAKVLNSPPDSVLEDADKSHSKSHKENVEMKNMTANKSKAGKQTRSPPRYLPLRGNPYNTTTVPIGSEKKKKCRANSTGRSDKHELFARYLQHSLHEEFANVNMEPVVPLSVFLIGGKEYGQITVFKRPISLWKLRLSSNVY